MAADTFSRFQARLDAPGTEAEAVTPGTAELAHVTRALYITTGGSVQVVMSGNGGTVNFGSVPAGVWLPIRVTKVLAAAGAVAIW